MVIVIVTQDLCYQIWISKIMVHKPSYFNLFYVGIESFSHNSIVIRNVSKKMFKRQSQTKYFVVTVCD